MLKRIFSLIMIISLLFTFVSCGKDDADVDEAKKDCWAGQYVMVNEETEEIKVLTIEPETETENDVVLTFKSVRGENEFKGLLKTKSKKYAVCNAGDRSLKFNLKSTATVVTVDDIWTNPETRRNENWTGKYVLLQEGAQPENFGDASWNGIYECNGFLAEVYAIKEGLVLLTYTEPQTGENLNFKCYVTPENKKEAVYEDENRTISIKLIRSNRSIVITDTASDEAIPTISGRYAA